MTTRHIHRKAALRLVAVVAAFSLVASVLVYNRSSLTNKQLHSFISGNITKTSTGLTVVGNGTFFIYTIHGHQSVPGSRWDRLYVNGWEMKAAFRQKYKCCLRYENGTDGQAFSTPKSDWGADVDLKARLVVCESQNSALEAKPKWASLVLASESCKDRKKFHEVVYRLQEKAPSFAICGKIAYGRKDPRHLIEWMEYHKYMGASKMVIYTYADLHEPARKVLKYYVDEGILETVAMPVVPRLDKYPRHFSVQNTTAMWHDEKVPLLDTEQRLRPYTFYAVIDTDEFIMPKQKGVKTLVKLMEHLLRKYKNGGTFQMKSEIYIMDWNKTNAHSDLMIEQYGNRTQSMQENPKLLSVSDRVREGSVWIHSVDAKPGYAVIDPSAEEDVVLKHFRKCREEWLRKSEKEIPNKCHGGFKRLQDGLMEGVAKVIGPRIRNVKALLGL